MKQTIVVSAALVGGVAARKADFTPSEYGVIDAALTDTTITNDCAIRQSLIQQADDSLAAGGGTTIALMTATEPTKILFDVTDAQKVKDFCERGGMTYGATWCTYTDTAPAVADTNSADDGKFDTGTVSTDLCVPKVGSVSGQDWAGKGGFFSVYGSTAVAAKAAADALTSELPAENAQACRKLDTDLDTCETAATPGSDNALCKFTAGTPNQCEVDLTWADNTASKIADLTDAEKTEMQADLHAKLGDGSVLGMIYQAALTDTTFAAAVPSASFATTAAGSLPVMDKGTYTSAEITATTNSLKPLCENFGGTWHAAEAGDSAATATLRPECQASALATDYTNGELEHFMNAMCQNRVENPSTANQNELTNSITDWANFDPTVAITVEPLKAQCTTPYERLMGATTALQATATKNFCAIGAGGAPPAGNANNMCIYTMSTPATSNASSVAAVSGAALAAGLFLAQ